MSPVVADLIANKYILLTTVADNVNITMITNVCVKEELWKLSDDFKDKYKNTKTV